MSVNELDTFFHQLEASSKAEIQAGKSATTSAAAYRKKMSSECLETFSYLQKELAQLGGTGNRQKVLQELDFQAKELENTVQQTGKKADKIKAEADAAEQRRLHWESKLSERSHLVDSQEQELSKYCSTLKKLLDMDVIVEKDQGFTLKFMNLDEKDPAREFSCELKIDDVDSLGDNADEYLPFKILSCQPEIDPQRLASLTDLLIETGDLSGFAVALRKAFRDLANKA